MVEFFKKYVRISKCIMDKLVNIFILNWNGKLMTLDCLRSFEKVTYPNTVSYTHLTLPTKRIV